MSHLWSVKIAFLVLLAASAACAQTANGNITYTVAATTVSFQCSNGKWTDFGLSMTVNVYVNGSGPHAPMAETGLPTIKLSWFVNGAAANATLTNSFNVANVVSSNNIVNFDLMDDQPSIGGTFAVGTCTQGQTQPAITVAMSSSTFIIGQGFTNPTIPAVNGIPSIVNQFPAANNAGGSTGTSVGSNTLTPTAATTIPPTVATTRAPTATTTTAVTLPPTHAPTVASTHVPTAAPTSAGAVGGNITYTVTPNTVAFQCSNGKWTDFGLTMTIQVIVNGVGPMQPMAETGLPTLNMAWFVNGAAANANLAGAFNVANATSTANVVSFTLMDDQPSVGGTFTVGTCTQGQTQPAITVKISSSTFIVGQGLANPAVAAVSGVPTIVNKFPAANNAGGSIGYASTTVAPTAHVADATTTSTTAGSSQPSSTGLIVGFMAGLVVIGGVVFGVKRFRKQRGEAFLPGPKSPVSGEYVSN